MTAIVTKRYVFFLEVAEVHYRGGCCAQIRLAAGLLGALAGRPHALRLLLASHSARLKRAQTLLLKPQNAGAPTHCQRCSGGLQPDRTAVSYAALAFRCDDVIALSRSRGP